MDALAIKAALGEGCGLAARIVDRQRAINANVTADAVDLALGSQNAGRALFFSAAVGEFEGGVSGLHFRPAARLS